MLPLTDKWIVVTRPKHQADNLREQLESAGANVILFPLLEIREADNQPLVRQQLSELMENDLAVFISPNAVKYTLDQIDTAVLKSLKIAAVGKKTADLLSEKGIKVDFSPADIANSEALLEMQDFRRFAKAKKVVILRGDGGRELIKESLQKLGAQVSYISVYKRVFPHINLELLNKHFKQNKLDIILISSGNSLKNLFSFQSAYGWLNNISLLVGSERIKEKALRLSNYQGVVLSTEDPTDEKIYQRLLQWAKD